MIISNSQKISGIVRQESRCEISAIPDATVVSLPYEAGTTTVLSPNGIASEQSARSDIVLSILKSFAIRTNIKGYAISLMNDTM